MSEPMNITEPVRCALARSDAGYPLEIDHEDLAALLAAYDRLVVPAQQTWKPRETAPKDGQTFYAMTWHGSFDGSLHWALYWNGEHFESVNNGTEYVEQFTHWIVPEVSALPSAFPSTECSPMSSMAWCEKCSDWHSKDECSPPSTGRGTP